MATRLDGIANYLQGIRPQSSPLDSMMLQRSLKNPPPIIKAGETYANAGMFGGPATLPSNPGPPDPPILPGAGLPNSAFTGPLPQPTTPWRTRLDPNMGYIDPSITISGGGPNSSNPPPTSFSSGGITFGPGGQLQGGTRGPQGSVYGIDPNTNQPIYNVTGSPKPGFFDSKTGKFVETLGSTGLNMFVPGLGFVSRAIFDAIRRRQAANNTGTDLSGNNPAPAAAPSGPAWFQPGYQLPAGIQGAIARGDYTSAYGASQGSIDSNKIMSGQSYGGASNNPGNTGDEGHTIFRPWDQGAQTHGQIIDGDLTTVRNTPEWMAAHPRPYSSPAMHANAQAELAKLSALMKANPNLYADAMSGNARASADSSANPFLAAYQEWIARRSALPGAPPLQIQPTGG